MSATVHERVGTSHRRSFSFTATQRNPCRLARAFPYGSTDAEECHSTVHTDTQPRFHISGCHASKRSYATVPDIMRLGYGLLVRQVRLDGLVELVQKGAALVRRNLDLILQVDRHAR